MATQGQSRAKQLSHPRYVMFFALLIAGMAALLTTYRFPLALVGSFDLAAGAFILSLLPVWFHSSPDSIRKTAARDDGGRTLLLALTAVMVAVVTVSVGTLLSDRGGMPRSGIAMIVMTLLIGWVFTNLVFAIHYAHVFYDTQPSGEDRGGLDFPGNDLPDFADFVHFAFVIGMTCQTADIAMTRQIFRRVVTFHGLFAFIFNLGIMALMVNVIAGIG